MIGAFIKVSEMVRMLFLRLERVRIAKNASALLLGQIVSYGIMIVYIAALARYVGTEGMGKISIANSINGLLILLVAPGITTLLVRDVAADHHKAATYVPNIFFTRLSLGIPYALLTSLVAYLVGYPNETVTIIHIYTLVYLLDALGGTLVAAFQAFERMEFEAAGNILQTVVNVSLSLLAIYLHLSLAIIAIASVIAQVCKLLFMLVILRLRLVHLRLTIDWIMSKSLYLASFPFGMLLMLFAIKGQTASFILSLYRPEAEVGIYSAANTLFGMLLFVPIAISTAIFPTFSRLAAQSSVDLQNFYQLCFKYLFALGCPLGMGTILIGGKVLLLIYGEEFEGSVAVLNILALFLFTIVGYSNSPLLKASGRQNFLVWTEALAVLANAVLCTLMVPRWGSSGAAIAFVLVGIGTFFVHSIAGHRTFGLRLPWWTMGKILLATLSMGLVISISLWLGIPWLIAAIILAPLAYGLSVFYMGIVKRDELLILAGAADSHSPAGIEAVNQPFVKTEGVP